MSPELAKYWESIASRYPTLPAAAKEMIAIFCHEADHNCYVSLTNAELALDVARSPETIRKYLRHAEGLGLIERHWDDWGRRFILVAPILDILDKETQ